jgi:hypothetical protein
VKKRKAMAWWRAYFPIVAIIFVFFWGLLPTWDRFEGSLIISLVVGAVVYGFAKLIERSPCFGGWKVEGEIMIRTLIYILMVSLIIVGIRLVLGML